MIANLAASLTEAIDSSIDKAVSELVEDLVVALLGADEPPLNISMGLMQGLRDHRYFTELTVVGDALVRGGQEHASIRRLYAQGLIDSGDLTAARYVLNDLLNDLKLDDFEYLQAKGLIGRIHKQIFVERSNSRSKISVDNLIMAIQVYDELYKSNPEKNLWHGINSVALKARGVRERLEIDGIEDYKEIARSIVNIINEQTDHSVWVSPIMAEAHLALGDGESALGWCDKLANNDSIHAFHVGSFLRQLQEVWQLNSDVEPGCYIIPKLQHTVLHKEGGVVDVDSLNAVTPQAKSVLQKNLGATGVMQAKWIERLIGNAKSVARIGKNSSQGLGTGFVVRGEDINPDWENKTLLLTNYHVISPTGQTSGLHWRNAVVSFYGSAAIYRIANVLWYSPTSPSFMGDPSEEHLDVVIAELDGEPEIDNFFSLGKYLPVVEQSEAQRVYLIGHPNGGGLSYSMQDNLLLDHEAPLIHYHAPTEPGSSGSPVFNEELELIGIHHAGSFTTPLLNGKRNPATRDKYPANEGIWIQSIIKKVNRR